MEEGELLVFIVGSSSLVVLLLIFLMTDIYLGFRREKKQRAEELALAKRDIENLLDDKYRSFNEGRFEERAAIAQSLHDGVLGDLVALKIHFKLIKDEVAAQLKPNLETLLKVESGIQEVSQNIRAVVKGLNDLPEERSSPEDYLLELKKPLKKAYDLTLNLDWINEQPISTGALYQLHRITQILISNTIKHANATVIECGQKMDQSELTYFYKDNGQGFNVDLALSLDGNGLKNILSRAEKIGGEVVFISERGEGMSCIITIKNLDGL